MHVGRWWVLFLCVAVLSSGPSSTAAQGLFSRKPNPPDTAARLEARWELTDEYDRRTLLLSPYRPIFFLPLRLTSDVNEFPVGRNPERALPDTFAYGPLEAKFQFSFKTKLINGAIFGKGDLWLLYTQQSLWQAYNRSESFPVRETNYRPGAMATYPIDIGLFGMRARVVGLGYLHASNGRALPNSRSWDRIVGLVGLERGAWSVEVRPWLRFGKADDDNPDISDFVGRGDIRVAYAAGANELIVRASHPLRVEAIRRGRIEVDWIHDLGGHFRVHLQATSGYGEAMIDYNHYQATVGAGVAFVPW